MVDDVSDRNAFFGQIDPEPFQDCRSVDLVRDRAIADAVPIVNHMRRRA